MIEMYNSSKRNTITQRSGFSCHAGEPTQRVHHPCMNVSGCSESVAGFTTHTPRRLPKGHAVDLRKHAECFKDQVAAAELTPYLLLHVDLHFSLA